MARELVRMIVIDKTMIIGIAAIVAVVAMITFSYTATSPAGEFSRLYQDSPVEIGGYSKCSISCTHCTGEDMCFKSCLGAGCRAECVPTDCGVDPPEHKASCTCDSYAYN